MSIRDAALLHNVPCNMLQRYVNKRKSTENPSNDFLHVGHQISLLAHEERVIAQNLAVMADWGCPLTHLEIQMAVRDFLNKSGRKVIRFKNNMPGIDWANNFIIRHKHLLCTRMCQNINKRRAEISTEFVNKFFENISHVLEGVPPTNIINYDETNFTNNPGKSQMIFMRGIKYPDKVMNFSKTSYLVMFAGIAAG
jgi:hypothetical protein